MVYLSILIPTLRSRASFYKRLTVELQRQIKTLEDPNSVQILAYVDNREKTTGHKRNVLLERATGLFVVHLDDDDNISGKYVKLIVEAIKNNPDIDAIGIRGLYSENGGPQEPFETSLAHNWEKKDGWYYRTINHISPIKREHAIKVKFPDKVHGEDFDYTMELKASGLLKKEVVIKENIYFYNFVSNKSY